MTVVSESWEVSFFRGKAYKEEVGEVRRELRYSGKGASGAKRITVRIKSCPNSKRPPNIQAQKLAALSQGHVLWRRPSCGRRCPRLGVPASVWTSCRGALQQSSCRRVLALLQESLARSCAHSEQRCANGWDAGAKVGDAYYSAELIH